MTSTHTDHTSHSSSIHNSSGGFDSAHSVSWTTPAGNFPSKLEGSLTVYKNAMNAVRAKMSSPPTAPSIPSTEKINLSTLQKIRNGTVGAYVTKYRYGSFIMNCQHNGAHSSSGTLTSTENTPMASWSKHGNAGGHDVHGNTSEFQTVLYSYARPSENNPSPSSSKALAADRNALFNSMFGRFLLNSSTINKSSTRNISGSTHTSHNSCSRTKKKEIFYFEGSALDLLNRVDIVGFKYKDDPDNIQHYGFIAEDTPSELATEFHDRMDYTNCIGILIKAIQEQQRQIEELQKSLK